MRQPMAGRHGDWQRAGGQTSGHRKDHRDANDRQSGQVTAGMVMLLALCGWMTGGDEGARRAVTSGLPSAPPVAPLSEDAMRQRYNARRLTGAEAPGLISALERICRQAGISRIPDVYVVPDRHTMNAYAFGSRSNAAITLTQALLSGMSHEEAVAILAHEVAHIACDDSETMALAAGLQRAICYASSSGLTADGRSHGDIPAALAFVLSKAPAIGELLCLALSRLREHAADVAAMEWIPNPAVLGSALEKLEQHHRWSGGGAMGFMQTQPFDYTNSHPSTDRRLELLRRLA